MELKVRYFKIILNSTIASIFLLSSNIDAIPQSPQQTSYDYKTGQWNIIQIADSSNDSMSISKSGSGSGSGSDSESYESESSSDRDKKKPAVSSRKVKKHYSSSESTPSGSSSDTESSESSSGRDKKKPAVSSKKVKKHSSSSESTPSGSQSDTDSPESYSDRNKKKKRGLSSSTSSDEKSTGRKKPPMKKAKVEDGSFKLPSSPDHFSQGSYPSNKQGRGDFNEVTVEAHIGKLQGEILEFKKNPNFGNFKALATSIATLSNKAYHSYKLKEQGPLVGTVKHTLCQDFMLKIIAMNPGTTFDAVKTEYDPDKNNPAGAAKKTGGAAPGAGSRLDLVWLDKRDPKNKVAYVIDYKFGEQNKGTTTETKEKYKLALKSMGYTLKMSDINPSN
jgi:hypothetical protein